MSKFPVARILRETAIRSIVRTAELLGNSLPEDAVEEAMEKAGKSELDTLPICIPLGGKFARVLPYSKENDYEGTVFVEVWFSENYSPEKHWEATFRKCCREEMIRTGERQPEAREFLSLRFVQFVARIATSPAMMRGIEQDCCCGSS